MDVVNATRGATCAGTSWWEIHTNVVLVPLCFLMPLNCFVFSISKRQVKEERTVWWCFLVVPLLPNFLSSLTSETTAQLAKDLDGRGVLHTFFSIFLLVPLNEKINISILKEIRKTHNHRKSLLELVTWPQNNFFPYIYKSYKNYMNGEGESTTGLVYACSLMPQEIILVGSSMQIYALSRVG